MGAHEGGRAMYVLPYISFAYSPTLQNATQWKILHIAKCYQEMLCPATQECYKILNDPRLARPRSSEQLEWKAFSFFSISKQSDVSRYDSNIICTSTKKKQICQV